ncbi:hypothetical protein D9M71_716000 [compost metagenome]
MPLGPAADRRDNQSREVCGEQCVCQAMGLRHCRGEVVQQHIGAGQQILQLLVVGRVLQFKGDTALAAIEHRKECLVISGRVAR